MKKLSLAILNVFLAFWSIGQTDIEKQVQLLIDSSEIKLVIQTVDRVFDSCTASEQAHLLHYKALAYSKYKNFDSMLIYMDLALQSSTLSDSVRIQILNARSKHHQNNGEFRLSEKDKLKLLELDPKQINNYLGISTLYGNAGKYEECYAILDSGLAVFGKKPNLINNYSYYLGQAGDYQTSIAYAKMGLELDSLNDWTRSALNNNQGYAYLKLGKKSKALKLINKAIEINPTNSYAYFYRSRIKISKNDYNGSCEDLKFSYKYSHSESVSKIIAQECK